MPAGYESVPVTKTVTYSDVDNRYTVIRPDDNVVTNRYEIHLNDRQHVIDRQEGETDSQLWARVLTWLAIERARVAKHGWPGEERSMATIYACHLTPESSRELFHRHLVNNSLHAIRRIAEDTTCPASLRAEAVKTLQRLYGVATIPKSTTASQTSGQKRR